MHSRSNDGGVYPFFEIGARRETISDSCRRPNQIRLEESDRPFRTSREWKLQTASLFSKKANCHCWVPISRLLHAESVGGNIELQRLFASTFL